jgi:hypothetical protein
MRYRRCTEREGFEPSNEVDPRYAISNRARSTAPAPLQRIHGALGNRSDRVRSTAPALKATTRASGPLLRSSAMVLAISKAASTDIGLIATFGGIGLIVNAIIVYIAVQIRGERLQNQEYHERMLDQ